jgi:hypothetical protein
MDRITCNRYDKDDADRLITPTEYKAQQSGVWDDEDVLL